MPEAPASSAGTLAEQFPIAGYPNAQDNWPRLLELTDGKQYRLDRALAYISLMTVESGGREDAIGDSGHSVGLWQLHDAGAGKGLTVEERKDPEVQYRVFIPQIDRAFDYAVAAGYRGEDLVALTGGMAERPYDDPANPYDGPYQYGKRYREIVASIRWADQLELR